MTCSHTIDEIEETDVLGLHTCPYQADVNNNSDFVCNCCAVCTQECAEDI